MRMRVLPAGPHALLVEVESQAGRARRCTPRSCGRLEQRGRLALAASHRCRARGPDRADRRACRPGSGRGGAPGLGRRPGHRPATATPCAARPSTTAPTSTRSPRTGISPAARRSSCTPRPSSSSPSAGSRPGFAYLTGLPEDRGVPRRQTPRTAGSRGLGGARRRVQRRLPQALAGRLAADRPHRACAVGSRARSGGAAHPGRPGPVRRMTCESSG